jgi:hypothetical protein
MESDWSELGGILYGCYAIGDFFNSIFCVFLRSVIPTCRSLEFVRCINVDAIAHDPLRVFIINLTYLNPA